jgi:hypothetical protein
VSAGLVWYGMVIEDKTAVKKRLEIMHIPLNNFSMVWSAPFDLVMME